MRESTLARFLSGEVDATLLRRDLANIVGTSILQTGKNLIPDLSFEMEITKDHLIRLCQSFLKGDLDSDELEAVAFFLQGSDHFVWNTDSKEGELIAEILFDWSAPKISHPLTRENVNRFLAGLSDGRNPFPG
jgi:hypothetical protein